MGRKYTEEWTEKWKLKSVEMIKVDEKKRILLVFETETNDDEDFDFSYHPKLYREWKKRIGKRFVANLKGIKELGLRTFEGAWLEDDVFVFR